MNKSNRKPQVIAEIASAHCGNKHRLFELLTASHACKADFVKVQILQPEHLALKTSGVFDVFKPLAFSKDTWREFFQLANELRIKILVELFDLSYLEFIESLDPYGYKIHATNILEKDFLQEVTRSNRKYIISTSGLSENDIDNIINAASCKKESLLLSCGHQSYPTDISNINLSRIMQLKTRFDLPVVFSDHVDAEDEWKFLAPYLAFAAGADVIEKHIILARPRKDNDFYSSLEPSEFSRMINQLNKVSVAMGSPDLTVFEDEKNYLTRVGRKLYAARDMNSGERLIDKPFYRVRDENPDILVPDPVLINKSRLINSVKKEQSILNTDITTLKVGICIIMRMKSERLPRKAVVDVLEGVPLVNYLIRRLKYSQYADKIILCTSNLEQDRILAEAAKQEGIDCIAGDPLNVFNRLEQAIINHDLDIVVRVTGDNPLMDPCYIDSMVEHHIREESQYTFNNDLPIGTKAEIICAKALQDAHKKASDPNLSEYMTFFFKDSEYFKNSEFKSGLEKVANIRLTVDFEEDIKLVRLIADKFPNSYSFNVDEMVEFLNNNPDLISINQNIDSPFDHSIKDKCFIKFK